MVETQEQTAEQGTAQPTIDVRGVTKRFGSNVAVNDVSFQVYKGEVVGFLGPNGSGKTTTMRLITSFYTPDSGTIQIEGVDNQAHDRTTRAAIGYLPENNPLYEDMLVTEYLEFVSDLRGLTASSRRPNIEQAVEETGLHEVYYRPINQLSKGYHQRVGLAGAILHRPDILIMDEPTEGLDPNQRLPIRELIRAVGVDRTVLLSTHVLQEVQFTCDRLLIISRGRIVEQGSVEELRNRARSGLIVQVEIEGDDIEKHLRNVKGVSTLHSLPRVEGRERYSISVSADKDVRPDIFQLAKRRNWVIWDMHQESGRLEDLFHELTVSADEARPWYDEGAMKSDEETGE